MDKLVGKIYALEVLLPSRVTTLEGKGARVNEAMSLVYTSTLGRVRGGRGAGARTVSYSKTPKKFERQANVSRLEEIGLALRPMSPLRLKAFLPFL